MVTSINKQLRAGGAMTTGRNHDPKGVKTVVISFEIAAKASV
jgi:hypothetical protein